MRKLAMLVTSDASGRTTTDVDIGLVRASAFGGAVTELVGQVGLRRGPRMRRRREEPRARAATVRDARAQVGPFPLRQLSADLEREGEVIWLRALKASLGTGHLAGTAWVVLVATAVQLRNQVASSARAAKAG